MPSINTFRPAQHTENRIQYVPERGLAAGILRRTLVDMMYKDTCHAAIQWFMARKSYIWARKTKHIAFGFQDIIDILELSSGQVKVLMGMVNDCLELGPIHKRKYYD